MDFYFHTLANALSQNRTIGYPLLIKGVGIFSPGLALLPHTHLLMLTAAALMLWKGLRVFGLALESALLIGSFVIWSDVLERYGWQAISDVPAAACALFAVGVFFYILGRPNQHWMSIILCLCTAATWLIRPGYAFLALWFPAMTLWLAERTAASSTICQPFRLAFKVAIITVMPLLLFCLLRLTVVGNFGIVSFQGGHLIGLAAYGLDSQMLSDLPEEVQEPAKAIIDRNYRPQDFTKIGKIQFGDTWFWNNLLPNWWRERAMMHEAYSNLTAFPAVGIPNAVESRGINMVEADWRLMKLSLEIIYREPIQYFKFVGGSFLVACWHALRANRVMRFLSLLLAASLLLYVCGRVCQNMFDLRFAKPDPPILSQDFKTMVVAALSFYFAGLLPVILLQVPRWRYLSPLSIFIPPMALWLSYNCLRWVICLIFRSSGPIMQKRN